MANAIADFFQGYGISNELIVFLVSLLPIVELRGAVPLGVFLGLDPWTLFGLAVLGNMLPVPFIILLARPVVNFFLRTKLLRPLGNWLEQKVKKNREKVVKYEIWGLFLFVAIPLPGTGAWSGALIAALLDIRMKYALPAIVLGVLIAGVLMTLGSYGFVSFLSGI